MKIAHIVNPVKVGPQSDLYRAQPVTFETMRIARRQCGPGLEVEHFTAQYPEDRGMVPGDFTPTPDLERSVLDVADFKIPRKLPLLKDILDRLYEACDADYLVYTNVDIALQPYFYQILAHIAGQGKDAFIINRRTISDQYHQLDDIPLMYAETGREHPGWDCFIFKRDLYPGFDLGTACIGSGWIGRVAIVNMAAPARDFHIFTGLHGTFHLGDDQAWKNPDYDDYLAHNRGECARILDAFEQRYGPFDREQIPGRFFKLLNRT